MKLGSLFDGSGGFPLAATLNGITPVWAAEVEPYPIAVTRSRFPQMKHYGNVCEINGAELEPVDIISAGSPCQDLSVAGLRAGIYEGKRSNLFFESIRIIKEMRMVSGKPRYFVWENVPGAFSSDKGGAFQAVLEAVCSVRETVSIPKPQPDDGTGKSVWTKSGCIVGTGYSIAWRVFDAQYWGVPQRRARIYLVADFDSECAAEILFKSDSLRGDMQQGDAKGQEAAADAMGRADGSAGECLTLKERFGCDGGGKGALWSDKAFTLSTMQDMSVAYPTIALVSKQYSQNIVMDVANPLLALNYKEPQVIALQANGIDRADNAGCNGCGWRENQGYTLNTIDRHAVCYGIDHVITTGGNCTAQGPCVYEDIQATLKAAGVHAVAYSFDSLASNSMKSSNPFSGCREVEISKTLDTFDPNPSKNQGGIAVVEVKCYENHQHGGYREGCGTLRASGAGLSRPAGQCNETDLCVVQKTDRKDNKIGTETKANTYQILQILRKEIGEESTSEWGLRILDSFQQKGILRHEVHGASISQGRNNINQMDCASSDGKESETGWKLRNLWETECNRCSPQGWQPSEQQIREFAAYLQELSQQDSPSETFMCDMRKTCEGVGLLCETLREVQEARQSICGENQPTHRRYIIRRLTPIEAARLQGFPDRWGELAPYDGDDAFWEQVRRTHAEINGKAYKPTKNIRGWYEKLHNDGAEYKMWGNGIALPCAEFVIWAIRTAHSAEGE